MQIIAKTNNATGTPFSGDAQHLDAAAIAELNTCEFTKAQVRKLFDNLNIEADVKLTLYSIFGKSIEVVTAAGKIVIWIGRKILDVVLFLLREFPNAAFGVIFGIVVAYLIGLIPIIGFLFGHLIGTLLAAFGLIQGTAQDLREKDIERRVGGDLPPVPYSEDGMNMLPGDNERLRTWHDRFTALGIDSPLSHPLCFKKELHIGKTAYRSLKIKKRVFELLRPIGAAGVGATVASSSAVATTFFPAGILGALGLATAATPVGWVIGTAVFSGAAWAVITKKLDSLSSSRVVEIPKFINTPLDLLAVSIFDLVCSLAVKLAAIDGEFHERERIRITRYLVETWGYDERFVTLAMDMVNESDLGFNELLTNLVEFTRSNRDCNAPAISQNVLAFLHEVAEASDGIRECERHALLNAERAFTPDRGKFRTSVAKAKRRLLFRRSTSAPPKPAAPRSSSRRTPAATAVRSGANRAAKGFAAAKDAAAGGLTAARVTGVDALKGVADKGSALLRSGVAGAEAGLAATSAAAGSRLHSGAEAAGVVVRSGASGVAAGFSTAHGALAGFAENLDWSTIDPTQYLYAGTRGVSRGLEEARLVWESIPERLRALGPEEVGKRLEGFRLEPHPSPQSGGQQ